ncbi:MAG: excinuclease ABC subunit UvrA [Chlamydiae bacterium]|nr:excinuclease ABC subunit UvrA [Chlamydiota bacterium]
MEKDQIVLKKVRVHNIKNESLTLDKNQLIVFTGVSGSGKSSLAFDTIYVEGQRRYIESLSTYARRHMGDLPKPDADLIEGISPTIAIEQKTTGKNPRSTVGTMTGLYDFLRVLFARVGIAHCPVSGDPVKPQSTKQIAEKIFSLAQSDRIILLSPFAEGKKGEFKEDFADLIRKGYTRVRLDGKIIDLTEEIALDGKVAHDIDVVIDRITADEENKSRLTEGITAALEFGKGIVKVLHVESKEETLYSQHAFCKASGLSYGPLEPSDFSFNHPLGMCPACQGLGITQEFDVERVINPLLSISEDCCQVASSYKTVRYGNIYDNLAKIYNFSVTTPWNELPEKGKNAFLYGIDSKWTKMLFVHPIKKTRWHDYIHWKGVLNEAKDRFQSAQSDLYRNKMKELMHEALCPACKGAKIRPYPAATTIGGKRIYELTNLPIGELLAFVESLSFDPLEKLIADEVVKEIRERLYFLNQVGLSYLSLERTAPTLSGGEGQRVRLASQIGSGLVGSTYILDEPSIGLHPRDNQKLLLTLKNLRDKGNTVIVVEHDEETIECADTVVDVGPLAGQLGGKIIIQGTVKELMECPDSLTGGYLSGRLSIPIPKKRKKPSKKKIKILGANHHNLKNIDVSFPLGVFTAVTGVSGSGKSSLVIDILYPALTNHLHHGKMSVGAHKKIEGLSSVDKIIAIDQSPIGRTPRSNPATYIKLFDEIRDLFCQLPESKASGFDAGRFSFNVKEGSCPFCGGMGMCKIDMDFMEDEWVSCEHCHGQRFDCKTLSILFKGKNIHDVLELTIAEAASFFSSIPKITAKLDLLLKVGLDYLKLGQPSPTLSGGEAQRIKLAKELSRPSTGDTFYILDEPTTGLHFHDCKKLIEVLHSLVEKGNTVLVIEHNMDLIKTADWIIDIGPEAGMYGGTIVSEGTPEKIAEEDSPTGRSLKTVLHKRTFHPSPQKNSYPKVEFIDVKGACQNNLKNLDVKIPRDKITVCTGPSGSGKSSFAFETIYAEGQRRYIESLSHYARQFVKQMPKPKVESIEGLSAAIAIEQKSHAGNPRSTIGTMTETYDYLRVLFAHLGTAYCPETGELIQAISKEYVVNRLLELPEKTKLHIMTPYTLGKQETFELAKEKLLQQGFLRIRLNGTFYELDEEISFDKKRSQELLLVIDRLIVSQDIRKRLFEALELADKISKGTIIVAADGSDMLFNLSFAVESTGKSYPPITPHTFSFNTEQGMCLDCLGLGFQYGANFGSSKELMELSPLDLISYLWKEHATKESLQLFLKILQEEEIDPDAPIESMNASQLQFFFHGDTKENSPKKKKVYFRWKGINNTLINYTKSPHGQLRPILTSMMEQTTCLSCQGARLNPLARNVKIGKTTLPDLCKMSIEKSSVFVDALKISSHLFLQETLDQLKNRLRFLLAIGLGYLSLERTAPTLSGGETQRIRLSRQLGSGLTGCIYVLDEPTIGLHPHNNDLLNKALKSLCDLGNTLILVEHDPLTIKIADHIIDFGPEAGVHGGMITAEGSLQQILKDPNSLTGAYLSGRKKIPLPSSRRSSDTYLTVFNASIHNLKGFDVDIPCHAITCITGVSGAGKSTLLLDIICPAVVKTLLSRSKEDKMQIGASIVKGISNFDKCLVLDQNPIGQTSRADVSTYVDVLTPLRYLYASVPEAKTRGLQPKHFSFNHRKGMCTGCFGLGTKNISLQFLPPVKVPCESCKGYRLNPLSLQVYFKGKHLGEVLQMTVEEALYFFDAIPKIRRILDTLVSVGLGYVKLGQEISTLSGGETQRIRLSRELAKRSTGRTLYLLDEPSIGLHSEDIAKLAKIFQELADKGNTLIMVEHNLDLMAASDKVIDIGQDAGEKGGELIAQGTPEEVALNKRSYTAKYLKEHLEMYKLS